MSKTSGHARHAEEWYVEQPFASRLLFQAESFTGYTVWDPACGQGNILRSAAEIGLQCYGSDIVNRKGDVAYREIDFLTITPDQLPPGVLAICSNPPYRRVAGAEAFIRKAIELGIRKHAWLVQRDFPYSERRHALFIEHPPKVLYHLSTRVSCPPGDMLARGEIKHGGGSVDYLWAVWEPMFTGETVTRWLKA